MGRNPCCPKEALNKGAWSSEEDEILTAYVNLHGEGKWRTVVENAGLNRCVKSCRLRWLNYLKPGIKRGNISRDEEDLIIRLHCLLGNRWALIAGRLPGRTDNEIKNYWNTILVKKLQKRSIRPNYPRQLLPFKSQVPFEDHEAMELESFHIPESNQLVNPNRCSPNVSPFPSKPADKCDDAGDSLGFFIDAVAGGSEISGHKLLEDVNDLLLVSSSSPSGSLISRDEGKVIESEVKNNGHGPILAMELKKLASFLDLEDEWREIQLDQDSTI